MGKTHTYRMEAPDLLRMRVEFNLWVQKAGFIMEDLVRDLTIRPITGRMTRRKVRRLKMLVRAYNEYNKVAFKFCK